jgi:hypothetical protein
MASAKPHHDASFGQEIGSRYLACQDCRMVQRYADDAGKILRECCAAAAYSRKENGEQENSSFPKLSVVEKKL